MVTDNIPISNPWILNIGMLSMQEIVPYIGCWFRIHTLFRQNLSQPFRILLPRRLCNCVFKRSFHYSKPVASRWWKDGNTSKVHELKTNATLIWLWSDVLHQKQCCVEYHSNEYSILNVSDLWFWQKYYIQGRKNNNQSKFFFFLQQGHDFSMIEESNVGNMPPGPLVAPVNGIILNVPVFVSAAGRLN